MFRNRRVLAVIPARGGSKGLPKKNLQPMRGVPLVVRAAQVALGLDFVDRAVVSTDDQEIARVAEEAGLRLHGLRPGALAGDLVPDWPVLHHELLAAEAADSAVYDILVMLQPTCPLRKPDHVRRAVDMLVERELDSVWTVSASDPKYHPLKQLVVSADGTFDYWDAAGGAIAARQQLSQLYHRNGAAYAITRQCLTEQKNIKGTRAGAVTIDEPLISIDSLWDLQLCEFLSSQEEAPQVVR